MKILIRTFIYLLASTFLSSCRCKKLYFEKNETFWTDVYKKGDISIFQSNQNPLYKDSIFILEKHIYKPTGECNPMVTDINPEGSVIDYSYSRNGIKSKSDYLVQHFKDEEGLSLPNLRIYDIEFHGKSLKDTTIITKNFGKLNDCFTFQDFEDFNNLKDFKIKNFVWSKKYGFVLFSISNGEKYELVEKTETSK